MRNLYQSQSALRTITEVLVLEQLLREPLWDCVVYYLRAGLWPNPHSVWFDRQRTIRVDIVGRHGAYTETKVVTEMTHTLIACLD